MADLKTVERLAAAEHLAVFTVVRRDGTVQASLVSAGVIGDPVDGTPGVGIVAGGGTAKLSVLTTATTRRPTSPPPSDPSTGPPGATTKTGMSSTG